MLEPNKSSDENQTINMIPLENRQQSRAVTLTVQRHADLAERIERATRSVFGTESTADEIDGLTHQFVRQSQDIAQSRGIGALAIAVVGAKGQGKTWLLRQMVHTPSVLAKLHSGVLETEATKQVHWIGTIQPADLDAQREMFHRCEANDMMPLSEPYLLLDTPGTTDSNSAAARIAEQAMALAPVKIIVVRRDQLRSAVNSIISYWVQGAICIPVVTAVPPKELPGLLAQNDTRLSTAAQSLQADVHQLVDLLKRAAPISEFYEPILVEDFESTGSQEKAGERFRKELQNRLADKPLDNLARSQSNRLSALRTRLERSVSKIVHQNAPELSQAIVRLHSEADGLPTQVVDAVTGSPVILQTAVRSRIRTQIVTDTSPLWFPYRAVLALLSLTQGAWDRLVLTLTGSVPSLFGTLASWAKNFRQTRESDTEMKDGIRERMHRQIEDRLQPINRQFHHVVRRLKNDATDETHGEIPEVRLDGVEELQSRSLELFERTIARHATPRSMLQLAGAIATLVFWVLLAGPIVSVYRQYFTASYGAFQDAISSVEGFPHPSPALFFTSVLLSLIPVLIGAMIFMAWLLRKSRIESISAQIAVEHRELVSELKRTGMLKLYFEDRALEQAEFLTTLGKPSAFEHPSEP
jgi:hypothetical protein